MPNRSMRGSAHETAEMQVFSSLLEAEAAATAVALYYSLARVNDVTGVGRRQTYRHRRQHDGSAPGFVVTHCYG